MLPPVPLYPVPYRPPWLYIPIGNDTWPAPLLGGHGRHHTKGITGQKDNILRMSRLLWLMLREEKRPYQFSNRQPVGQGERGATVNLKMLGSLILFEKSASTNDSQKNVRTYPSMWKMGYETRPFSVFFTLK